MSNSIVITGGEGVLARALQNRFQTFGKCFSPGRDELDVTDSKAVSTYFKQLDRLNLCICNAGAIDDNLLVKISERSWREILDTNLSGAFRCAREASKIMLKQKCGHIIFISSFSVFDPPLGQAHYAAAKAGLIGLTQSLAKELGKKNIRINCICPGLLKSPMTENISKERKEEALKKHTLSQQNTPENVSSFIHFLHESMLATSGQVFNLDSRVHRQL